MCIYQGKDFGYRVSFENFTSLILDDENNINNKNINDEKKILINLFRLEE